MSKKWMGLCSMAVVFMLVGVGGCSKKKAEEAAETEAVEEVATDVAQSVGMAAVGTYMATLPAAGSPSRMIMLSLNGDNTASMSVDLGNNQAPVVENGSWAWNETASVVELTLNRDVSGTMVSTMMTFAANGDTLSLSNPADAGYGDGGLQLVRQPAGQ